MRFNYFYIFAWLQVALALELSWSVDWVTANPDGRATRPVIGINGKWPCPAIHVNLGEKIVLHLTNNLGNETTSIHFHGFFQQGSNDMDGAVGATQCAIPPGYTFTYETTVRQPGTYWYHSHAHAQYMDGLRGPIIVHDPGNPYAGQFDEELILTVSDWYHDPVSQLAAAFESPGVPPTHVPIPYSALINDAANSEFQIKPGKTYLVHAINIGGVAGIVVHFDQHSMTVVEVDGVYTEPVETDQIVITPAQRYSVLIHAKDSSTQNYGILASMFTPELPGDLPSYFEQNATATLVYDDSAPKDPPVSIPSWAPLDDTTLVPQDQLALFTDVAQRVTLSFDMTSINGLPRGIVNGQTFIAPDVPTLYTVLNEDDCAANSSAFDPSINPFVTSRGQVVEIVLNNLDATGGHPFHFHGHNFQVIYRSPPGAGVYDPNQGHEFPAAPIRRDTIGVFRSGSIVLRYESNNPGVWLFHCHNQWHFFVGLAATFIENPRDLQHSLKIPENHLKACKAQDIDPKGKSSKGSGCKRYHGTRKGQAPKDPLDLRGALKHVEHVRRPA